MSIISLNLLKLFQKHTLPIHLRHSRMKKLNGLMFRVAAKVIKRSRSLYIRIGRDLPLYDLAIKARKEISKIHCLLKKSDIWIRNKAILN